MGMCDGVPGHYFSPETVFWGGPCVCKLKGRFSFIQNWYSYILRGITIASLSGIVVVLFVVLCVSWGCGFDSVLVRYFFFRAAYKLFILRIDPSY